MPDTRPQKATAFVAPASPRSTDRQTDRQTLLARHVRGRSGQLCSDVSCRLPAGPMGHESLPGSTGRRPPRGLTCDLTQRAHAVRRLCPGLREAGLHFLLHAEKRLVSDGGGGNRPKSASGERQAVPGPRALAIVDAQAGATAVGTEAWGEGPLGARHVARVTKEPVCEPRRVWAAGHGRWLPYGAVQLGGCGGAELSEPRSVTARARRGRGGEVASRSARPRPARGRSRQS